MSEPPTHNPARAAQAVSLVAKAPDPVAAVDDATLAVELGESSREVSSREVAALLGSGVTAREVCAVAGRLLGDAARV